MNTKEFYSVLVPLINLILTGKKEVAIEDDCIKLSEGYKFSMEEYAQAKQSTHFYKCIFEFLEHLNQQQKVDVVKIIVENDALLILNVFKIMSTLFSCDQSQLLYT